MQLQANIVEVAVHGRHLGGEIRRRNLQCLHSIIPLVTNPRDAHQLEVHHAMLKLGDAVSEVCSLVVGDDGGVVLGGVEALQQRDLLVERRIKL